MKNKIFFFTAILIIFSSCASKRVVTDSKKIETKIDTVILTKDRTVIERFTDTLRIEKPCDSLGQIKSFKQAILTPQGKIDLYSNEQGGISLDIDLKAYEKVIEARIEKKYEKLLSENTKTITKYRTPLWLIIYSVLITVICGLILRFK